MKCEVIMFKIKSSVKSNGEDSKVDEDNFPVRSEATCLGYRWRQDLFKIVFKEPGGPSFNLEMPMPFRAS